MREDQNKEVIPHDKSSYAGKEIYKERSKDHSSAPVYLDEVVEDGMKDRAKYIEDCINDGVLKYGFNKSFYVVIETKYERFLKHAIKDTYLTRLSCPSPGYDQTVFHYNAQTGDLSFVWSIPDKDSAEQIYNDGHVKHGDTTIVPDDDMVKTVKMFYDGSMLYEAMKANKEVA